MKRFVLFTFASFLLISSFAKQGYLGIVINDFTDQKVTGVQVNDVIENSAAQQYGIKQNDIITAVNGIIVQKKEELIKLLANYSYGEEVNITYSRNGAVSTEKVNLGNKPEPVVVKVTKESKQDGEHWTFPEDKTELVVKEANNAPVSVLTKDENGTVKVSKDFAAYEEKFGYIQKIKSDRSKCGCNCPITQYTFYKINKEALPAEAKAISNTLLVDKFNITPNPSTGKIRVDIASNEKGTPSFSIFNVNGDVVQTDMLQNFVGDYSKEYSLENLPKGTYMIQLKIGEKMTSKKFILQ